MWVFLPVLALLPKNLLWTEKWAVNFFRKHWHIISFFFFGGYQKVQKYDKWDFLFFFHDGFPLKFQMIPQNEKEQHDLLCWYTSAVVLYSAAQL